MKLFIIVVLLINSLFLIGAPVKTANGQLTQILDSTLTFDSNHNKISKDIFSYDDSSNCVKVAGYNLSSNIWEKHYEIVSTYNTANNKVSDYGYLFDDATHGLKQIYKYDFGFDTNGNYVSEEYFTRDLSETDWSGNIKRSYNYNPSGTISEVLTYDWDAQASAWIQSQRHIYGYDSSGNQTDVETYTYNSTLQIWIKNYKSVKQFDASNNILNEEYYLGEEVTNIWQKKSKTVYTYISGTKLETKLVYAPSADKNSWEDNTRYVFSYTGNNLTTINEYTWTGAWSIISQELYTYNASNQPTLIVCKLWNESTSAWDPFLEKNITYTGGAITEQFYVFDTSGTKIGSEKTRLLKDVNGNITEKEIYSWDNGNWNLMVKEKYAYNATSKMTLLEKYNSEKLSEVGYIKATYDYNTDDQPLLNTVFVWNEGQNRWAEDSEVEYFYSERVVTGIENQQTSNEIKVTSLDQRIKIMTKYSLSSVSIYSVLGKQMYNGREDIIATNGWQAGTYIVNVKTKEGFTRIIKVMVN